MDVVYREYCSEDLPRIKEITVAAFDGVSIDRNTDDLLGPVARLSWQERKAGHLDTDLKRPEATILVAEVERQIVGYVSTWMDRRAGQGFIPNLAVDQACRGQGIGRGLIERALDHFRRHQMTQARIETLDQNSIGQSLYPAIGFHEVARQIHYCLNLHDGPGDSPPR